ILQTMLLRENRVEVLLNCAPERLALQAVETAALERREDANVRTSGDSVSPDGLLFGKLLLCATARGFTQCITRLVEHGADLSWPQGWFQRLVCLAVKTGKHETVQTLL